MSGSALQDRINAIITEGDGLLVSSFVWLEDVPRMLRDARAGNASALFSVVLFAQALEREAMGKSISCLCCNRAAPLTHCAVVGGLHAPHDPTGAVMFVICDDCGAGDRDALVARGREAVVDLFEGGIRPILIHEDVGHA